MHEDLPCPDCLARGNLDLNLSTMAVVCHACDNAVPTDELAARLDRWQEALRYLGDGQRPAPNCPRCGSPGLSRNVRVDRFWLACDACGLEANPEQIAWLSQAWSTVVAWLAISPWPTPEPSRARETKRRSGKARP